MSRRSASRPPSVCDAAIACVAAHVHDVDHRRRGAGASQLLDDGAEGARPLAVAAEVAARRTGRRGPRRRARRRSRRGKRALRSTSAAWRATTSSASVAVRAISAAELSSRPYGCGMEKLLFRPARGAELLVDGEVRVGNRHAIRARASAEAGTSHGGREDYRRRFGRASRAGLDVALGLGELALDAIAAPGDEQIDRRHQEQRQHRRRGQPADDGERERLVRLGAVLERRAPSG